MSKTSAGLLIYRLKNNKIEVLLVHPGGPFWAMKDKGAWGIPKGEKDDGDNGDLLLTAIREVYEETGIDFSNLEKERFVSLGSIVQKNGKIVYAWAIEAPASIKNSEIDEISIKSNNVKRGFIEFPEVDKAKFFDLETAKEKIYSPQAEFLDRLRDKISF